VVAPGGNALWIATGTYAHAQDLGTGPWHS